LLGSAGNCWAAIVRRADRYASVLDVLLWCVILLCVLELIEKYVVKEWGVIRGAPVAFIVASLAMGGTAGVATYLITTRVDKAAIDGHKAATDGCKATKFHSVPQTVMKFNALLRSLSYSYGC